MLDAYCRAEVGAGVDLPDLLTDGLLTAYDASMLFLVTGTAHGTDELQRVVGLVPGDLWAGVFRAGTGEASGLAEYAGRPMGRAADLRRLLA